MTNIKQFTQAEADELLTVLENIDLQTDTIQNAEHLLTDYLELFTGADQKELYQLGYDAKEQFYKLQIIDDLLLRSLKSIKESLQIVPTAYDLYQYMKGTDSEAFTSEDQISLIDDLYNESYDTDPDVLPNTFNQLGVPSYWDEHCEAYQKLIDALENIFPGSSENQPYEDAVSRFEDAVSKVSFRSGFLCAVALNKKQNG